MFIDFLSYFVNKLFTFRTFLISFTYHCDLILPYIIIPYFYCNIVFPTTLDFKYFFNLYNE